MELLDLYDDNGLPTGKTIERGSKFTAGNIMLSIVFIKNSKEEYLIQKTSKEKQNNYGLTTIVREVQEELGLTIDPNEFKKIGLIKNPTKPCLINLYLLNKDIDIKSLKLQKSEVEQVMWLKKQDILKLIDKDEFLSSHGYLFKNYIIK